MPRSTHLRERQFKPDSGSVRVGIDLGGTTTKIAVMRETGEPQSFLRIDTGDHSQSGPVIRRLADHVHCILRSCGKTIDQCTHLGVALPGEIAVGERRLVKSPILPTWNEVPVADGLEEILECPVSLQNDANAALAAENRFGAGSMTGTVIMLTIGTGIGGSISFNGTIYAGNAGGAGEFGHVVVADDGPICNCRRRGCLGVMASANAFIRYFIHEARNRDSSAPAAIDICRLLEKGDTSARRAFDKLSYYLSRGLSDIVCTLAPDRVVLTGGLIIGLGDQLCRSLSRTLQEFDYPRSSRRLTLVCGDLADKAGAIGAALGGEHEQW